MHHKTQDTTTRVTLSPLRYILELLSHEKKLFFFTSLCVVSASLLSSSLPFVLRSIIDSATAIQTGGKTTTLWFWGILYPTIMIFDYMCWRASGFLGGSLAVKSGARSYTRLFEYLSRHSHGYFSDRFAGSLGSRVTHISEGAQSIIERILWNYSPFVLSAVLSFLFMMHANTTAGFLFLGLVVLLIPLNILLSKKRRPAVIAYSSQATKTRGYAIDTITNMSAVRHFSRASDEKARFTSHVNDMRALNIRQWRKGEWGLIANNILISVFFALIILLSIQRFLDGTLSLGELVMIITLLLGMESSLTFIGAQMASFVRVHSEMEDGLSEIFVPYEIKDNENAPELKAVNGNITISRISFSRKENELFKDFSLTIEPGSRVGLVGKSGAGKSTLVSLLLREHEITAGSICIDGMDIKLVSQDSLRNAIAVVPQEPLLFHRSIRENIGYGNPSASPHQIEEAAKKAHAHEFITRLSLGYNTLVGERGTKLSGGQRQRIAIARAILKDAPILLLDEATSALDSESESAIQSALQKLMKGKTVVAIAHRLSTLKQMDRIIVLEKGCIIEDGSHTTLLSLNGRYASLWKHQSDGFIVEESGNSNVEGTLS